MTRALKFGGELAQSRSNAVHTSGQEGLATPAFLINTEARN
jgi:hypothetical protein